MPPDRETRIANAANSLISHLIPVDPREDEEVAQERHDNCFELVQNILQGPASPAIASDVNHASDLIKRKLISTNPGAALRFTNLYSRLLSLPVLGQKWAILYLLYQLADSPDPNEASPSKHLQSSVQLAPSSAQGTLPHKHADGAAANARNAGSPLPGSTQLQQERDPARSRQSDKEVRAESRASKASPALENRDQAVFEEAFASNGLKKISQREADRPSEASANEPAGPRRDTSPKSTLLAGNNAEILYPPETAMLRDLPFTLQGLDSATLPFPQPDTIRLPSTLPAPIISLLHTLAEPSLLYRRLDNFLKTSSHGLLGQSLRAAIDRELRSYLTLVSTLEGQIRRALSSLDKTAPRGGAGWAGVTLKRCVVWTREATMGLRLMCLIAEESENKRGGQLISLIHGFSFSHGDPIVAAFAERLLGSFTRPFYDILRRWIYDGELSDPFLEFFVREQTAADGTGGGGGSKGGSSVWEDKYKIDEAMIPSIITQDFAQKVFLIGKSLNFIRHSCGDSGWVEDYSKAASKELRYGDTATLEAWIDEAYKTTMKRLIDLMANKFHLFVHLQALKKYILLGQGDFIALLMESLAANLDRPAGAQYRHTLTAQLDHAIRGSNAQYDSAEVLRRLDARMLQLSHGDIGWDCFTLEYKIDPPVDVVVTDWGSRQYLKVFNFLWRIKRVEFALASTWRKCMTGSRGVLQNSDPTVAAAWKATRGTLAEMIHFVGQLQYYILFEVIESSWNELQDRIHREGCTLDDLIGAHTCYLNDITHKGLLGPRRSRPGHGANNPDASTVPAVAMGATGEDDRTSYLAQLSDLLRTMLNYRDSVDGLYSWGVSDFTRRQEVGARNSRRARGPGGGGGDSGGPGEETPGADSGSGGVSSEFPVLMERLRQLGTSFRGRLQILLGDLAYQPDVDMRFLGVAMNFNDVYQPGRRKVKAAPVPGSTNR